MGSKVLALQPFTFVIVQTEHPVCFISKKEKKMRKYPFYNIDELCPHEKFCTSFEPQSAKTSPHNMNET